MKNELSRMTRSLMHPLELLKAFEEKKISLVSLGETMDTLSLSKLISSDVSDTIKLNLEKMDG
ncbi:MAG TPA: hypothetical protein PLI53_10020 [Geobacteraceae bacterium]|nr:hypothetical protein [Geobacteraceae bacterium]